jgi:diguanylate cyclase (GGDEF)-like protein
MVDGLARVVSNAHRAHFTADITIKGRTNIVRLTSPSLTPRTRLKIDLLRPIPDVEESAVKRPLPDQATSRKIVAMNQTRAKLRPEESLSEMLSSGMLAQDKELSSIVQDVDEILKSLKGDTPESQAVSDTLQRTVLCAVKQAILDRELRSLALTDDLTCLYNRRAFLALATQQVRLARRTGQGLLLFFADVDDLKKINDSFGHREGDFALIRTANALEQTFRDSDIVARLGGDEFGVLALEASSQNQGTILRRLDESIQESNRDEFRYRLSLSVGVARLDPKHFTSLGDLMEQADRAMYQEKKKKKADPRARGVRL